MLLLFLLFSIASAHVPTFDSTAEAYKISDKSWGVYRELKKNESFSIFLDVPKDENISFSINLAGSQDEKFDKDLTYIDVTLLGHNASQIHCDPKFTGWGYDNHTASRRLDGALDQSKHIHQKYGKLHFEPFGIGFYRALASCQGKVPVADPNFTVTVKALRVVPRDDEETEDDVLRISIGAGMAEQIDFLQEVLFLPVLVTRTWIWDLYTLGFIFSQMVGLMIIFALVFFIGPPAGQKATFCWKWNESYNKTHAAKFFMIGVLLHNITVYAIRMFATGPLVGYTNHGKNDFDDMVDLNLIVGWGIHVIIPAGFLFLVALFDLRYEKNGLKCAAFHMFHILFILYCVFFLIQTFWLGAVASIILYATKIQKSAYKRLSTEES